MKTHEGIEWFTVMRLMAPQIWNIDNCMGWSLVFIMQKLCQGCVFQGGRWVLKGQFHDNIYGISLASVPMVAGIFMF